MKKQMRRLIYIGIGMILVFIIFFCYQKTSSRTHYKINADSIFSWEAQYMELENALKVNHAMEELGCQAIYQEVSKDIEQEVVKLFLQRMNKEKKDVYYLAGAAEWGLSPGKQIMLQETELVAEWNKTVDNAGFAGIVWDVEPYLLDEWDEDAESVMKEYVDNCIEAYKLAKKKELKVIVCIPNFYDSSGQEVQLERLISSGCDAIAVMNYNKRDETGQISYEVSIAEKYEKGIINITEVQKPGYHSLTEENTYYHDGISGVKESWDRLKADFDYEGLGFSWHYLKPALKLLEEVGQ